MTNPRFNKQIFLVEVPLYCTCTGNANAVFANKIMKCIYLCSCVFMSHFGRDLNPIRDG